MISMLGTVQDFLTEVRFVHPSAFVLLLAPLILVIIQRTIRQREIQRLSEFGHPSAILALRTGSRGSSGISKGLMLAAWVGLCCALAGPRWGKLDEQGVAVGRDLLILIDFSRSMLAEDMVDHRTPARWQAATTAAIELVNELRSRGGQRVALVIFANRPKVIVPLTTDYDHVVFRLGELDATNPPAEIRPANDDAKSGTRIGAALTAAVETHDPRFPGFQDIILLTDGDDPVRDGEWRHGATAARNAGIPVHTVAIGDASSESFIILNGAPLETVDQNGVTVPIQSRTDDTICETIANDTLGTFVPSHRLNPDLGQLYRTAILDRPMREIDDKRFPQPRDRSGFFVALTIGLLVLAWWREP